VEARVDICTNRGERREGEGAGAESVEIHMEILELRAPVIGDLTFDTGADCQPKRISELEPIEATATPLPLKPGSAPVVLIEPCCSASCSRSGRRQWRRSCRGRRR